GVWLGDDAGELGGGAALDQGGDRAVRKRRRVDDVIDLGVGDVDVAGVVDGVVVAEVEAGVGVGAGDASALVVGDAEEEGVVGGSALDAVGIAAGAAGVDDGRHVRVVLSGVVKAVEDDRGAERAVQLALVVLLAEVAARTAEQVDLAAAGAADAEAAGVVIAIGVDDQRVPAARALDLDREVVVGVDVR